MTSTSEPDSSGQHGCGNHTHHVDAARRDRLGFVAGWRIGIMNILLQFLLETIMISIVGCLTG